MSCLWCLPTLHRLYISRNQIKTIPYALGVLDEIEFEGCVIFSCETTSITKKGNPLEEKFNRLNGSDAMLSFLKAASSGTKKMLTNKIKLVFIGDGGVGKTSLIKSFKRDTKLLPGNHTV